MIVRDFVSAAKVSEMSIPNAFLPSLMAAAIEELVPQVRSMTIPPVLLNLSTKKFMSFKLFGWTLNLK